MNVTTPIKRLTAGVSQQAVAARNPENAEAAENCWPSPVYGMKKRPPTQVVAQILATRPAISKFQIVDRDTEQYLIALFRDSASSGTPYFKVFDLLNDGAEMEVFTAAGSSLSYLSSSDLRESITMVSVGSGPEVGEDQEIVTIVANDRIVCDMDSATSASPASTGAAYLVVRQGAWNSEYGIRIDDGTNDNSYSFKTEDGTANVDEAAALPITGTYLGTTKTTVLADQFVLGINAMAGTWTAQKPTGTTNPGRGSVVEVTHSSTFDVFEAEDSVGDSYLITFIDGGDVPRVEGYLPDYCRHGVRVRVVGDQDVDGDEYWVQFEADEGSGAFGKGRWVESVGYDEEIRFDDGTMPHRFVRYIDDGTGPTSGGAGTKYFQFEVIPWADKTVGDSDTNKRPEFIGKRVEDVFYWKDRLGFVAEGTVSFSEAGEYYNHWRVTLLALRDSAPISFATNLQPPAYVKRAVIFNEDLVLTSKYAQLVQRGDELLSPRTVEVRESSRFEVSLKYRPITSGRSLFMPFKRGDYSGVYELFQRGDSVRLDEVELTEAVEAYIDGEIDHMAVSSVEDTLIIRTTDHDSNRYLYVYRYLWQGREKRMSAWTRWQMPEGCTAEWFDFIENDLYIVFKTDGTLNDGMWVEKLTLGDREEIFDLGFDIHIDRRRTRAECDSVSYDGGTGLTTITPGYTKAAGSDWAFILSDGRTAAISNVTTTSFTVAGDVTSVNDWVVGLRYTQSFEFTKPAFRLRQGQAPVREAVTRMQVRRLWLDVENSAAFRAVVTIGSRSAKTFEFNGDSDSEPNANLGAAALTMVEEAVRIPILGRAKDVRVVIESETAYPLNLVSATWESIVRSRSRRQPE